MDHEMEQAAGKDKLHVRTTDDAASADEADEEIEEMPPQNMITGQMEKFAGTRIGRMVFEKTDRVLKVFEDTAKWSLPQDEEEIELQRPLSWIFFLSLIVGLRVFRFCFSVVANILGFQPVTAKSMVYYLQTKRRRLRAIRLQGLKAINNKEKNKSEASNETIEKKSFSGNMRNLLNSAICRPGQRHEAPTSIQQVNRSSKRTLEEADLQDLTVLEMLDKFASEQSDDDSDYLPPENADDEDEDDSFASQNTTASADEAKKYVEENFANSKNDEPKDENPNIQEVKENGEPEEHLKLKPIKEIQIEHHNKVDSRNEQVHAPKQITEANNSVENGETKEMSLATAEVGNGY